MRAGRFLTLAASMPDAKSSLRGAMRKSLRGLSQAELSSSSERARARLEELPAFQSSAAVSVYLSMPTGECQTRPLLENMLAQGKTVFIPRVEGPNRGDMRMLRLHSIEQLDSFPRSNWGIPEPTEAEAQLLDDGLSDAVIDTVIVPAVAFDANCHRLGHGKGYYDTFLQKLCAARAERGLPRPFLVGFGLQEQLVECVPVNEFDFPLDAVCLPDVLISRS